MNSKEQKRMPLTSEKVLVELVQFETLFIQLLGVLAGSLHPLGPQLFKGTHTHSFILKVQGIYTYVTLKPIF